MDQEHFIDYYEILQLSRNADQETLERVYRLLAKRYHPDNTKTGDIERFKSITEAYSVLSKPEDRAEYDAHYESGKQNQWSLFFETPMSGIDEDLRIQQWILSLLYSIRRRNSRDHGMGIFELEKYLIVAEGQLEYHIWYLKEKGWIMRTDTGQYAITVSGVDAIIASGNQLLRRDRLLEDGNNNIFNSSSLRPKEGHSDIFKPQQKSQETEETEE